MRLIVGVFLGLLVTLAGLVGLIRPIWIRVPSRWIAGAVFVAGFAIIGAFAEAPVEEDSLKASALSSPLLQNTDESRPSEADPGPPIQTGPDVNENTSSIAVEENPANNDAQPPISSTQPDEQNENGSGGAETTPGAPAMLTVYFFDVGQGDAILLLGPDFTVLVDSGRHDRKDIVPYLEGVGVESIDLLVGTHEHADHIGQMDRVLQRFPVAEVWMNGNEHTTQTFERVIDAILASGTGYHEPRAGENEKIGSLQLDVLHPNRLTGDANNDSIVLRAVYGQVSFLLAGDAEASAEREMLSSGRQLKVDVLKLGHHGSSTSTTEAFLNAAQPSVAIYSAAEGNSYGHPHKEVVERVEDSAIGLYGTDVHGTIVVVTDGQTYEVTTTRAGEVQAPTLAKGDSKNSYVSVVPTPTSEPPPSEVEEENEPEKGGPEPQEPTPSLDIVALTTPVATGSTASLTVQTAPAISCSIIVRYKSGPSRAKGLENKATDSDGRVTWSWTVGARTSPGIWPVTVTCGAETVETGLEVR